MKTQPSSHFTSGRKAALRARLLPAPEAFSLAGELRRAGGDFRCLHCGVIVSSDPLLSGVVNRNHCPYCLHSKHLDWQQPGDRLAVCKAPMTPAALACKPDRQKYGGGMGELMLAHLCAGCGKLSLNRIAADDHPQALLDVFERSLRQGAAARRRLKQVGARPLGPSDAEALARMLG